VLFDARGPLDVAAIARVMGCTRSAAHAQLRELERLGFVARDSAGRWCLPAGGAMTLSPALIARLDLRATARPVIERLAAATGETVTLNVRSGEHRLRVDAVGARPALPRLPVGQTLPLHAGTGGKVILAFVPDAARPSDPLVSMQLAWARRRGYLAAVGDRLRSLASISVPLFGSSGVAASVTVVGPARRWRPEVMEEAAASLRMECAALSAALGSSPLIA
jgi:DNA-binding IclR family transcriptional regulator